MKYNMAHYKVNRVGLNWFSDLPIANSSYLQTQHQSMSLDDVEEIGKELGCGSYGLVYEVRVNGMIVLERLYMNFLLYIFVNDTMITTSCYLFIIERNIRQVC